MGIKFLFDRLYTAAIRMVTIDSGMELRNGIHIRPKTRKESV